MKKIKFWFFNARPVSLPQSLMPALVAVFLATKYSGFKWYLSLLCLLGVGFAHLSFNLFDDYFDFHNAEQGDRSALERQGIRAMTVKCLALQDGTVSPKQWLLVSCIFGAVACMFGLPVLIIRGINVLIVVLIVAVLGIFYSAPPLKLGYHGLGEIIIGCIFGPLIGIGISIGSSGEFHISEVLVSIAWGLLVVNILYVHSIMDFAADQKAGKKTLAWLVGSYKYAVLGIINFLPYALIIFGFIAKFLSPFYLISIFAFPWTFDLFKSMLAFKKDPNSKVIKKNWYGNFIEWDRIVENHLDWFMLRWYLAQKIDTVFCLLCILAAIGEMVLKLISIK